MLSMHENVNVIYNDENVVWNEKVSSSMNVSAKCKRCDNETSTKLWNYHLVNIVKGWGGD
jgi:hypothetical protein